MRETENDYMAVQPTPEGNIFAELVTLEKRIGEAVECLAMLEDQLNPVFDRRPKPTSDQVDETDEEPSTSVIADRIRASRHQLETLIYKISNISADLDL